MLYSKKSKKVRGLIMFVIMFSILSLSHLSQQASMQQLSAMPTVIAMPVPTP